MAGWLSIDTGLSVLLCASLGCLGCSDTEGSPKNNGGNQVTQPDPSAEFFAVDHLVDVKIEMADKDWQALRLEANSVISLNTNIANGTPDPFEYTFFNAAVTIDGSRYENVAVRKKGFVSSVSRVRPALKIDLDRNVDGQTHSGIRAVTLNNNLEDPSHTHQCMAYHLFAKAGLSAPRCNLAHLIVNGEDLGTYSNVEPIKATMLAHHFADAGGNLYEGQLADFDERNWNRIESKNNEKQNDRSDLRAVIAALGADDSALQDTLGAVVDLESFRDFWAMEALVGHYDSYSGNSNNYYAYHDPTTDRFFFLPWGTDATFEGTDPVYFRGKIANRLYRVPSERQRYRERLVELIDSLWDEPALQTEATQLANLATNAAPDALERQMAYIESHGAALRNAMNEPLPEWTDGTEEEPDKCFLQISDVKGTFQTVWGNPDGGASNQGTFSLELTLDGKRIDVAWSGGAGQDEMASTFSPEIRYFGTLTDGRLLCVRLLLGPGPLGPGVRPFHAYESIGEVAVLATDGDDGRAFAIITDGSVELEQASAEAGAPVVGRLNARLMQGACLD